MENALRLLFDRKLHSGFPTTPIQAIETLWRLNFDISIRSDGISEPASSHKVSNKIGVAHWIRHSTAHHPWLWAEKMPNAVGPSSRELGGGAESRCKESAFDGAEATGDVTFHTLKAEQSNDSSQFGHWASAVSSCLPINWAQIQSAAAPTAEQPE